MEHTTSETLEYVIFLTRHVKSADVCRAILILLMELGFPEQNDGFGHLRKAIFRKYQNQDMRFNLLYIAVGKMYDPELGGEQVSQGIRSILDATWKVRNIEKWDYFFPVQQKKKGPTNGDFIAKLACVIELWANCDREVVYAKR